MDRAEDMESYFLDRQASLPFLKQVTLVRYREYCRMLDRNA
jgi:hypothetical protein